MGWNHRELKLLCLVKLNETDDTCSGLLATAYHSRNKILILCVHKVYKVTAIIDDDIRTNLEHSSDMSFIFLWCGIIPSEDIESCLNKGCCNIVLGRKRITILTFSASSLWLKMVN